MKVSTVSASDLDNIFNEIPNSNREVMTVVFWNLVLGIWNFLTKKSDVNLSQHRSPVRSKLLSSCLFVLLYCYIVLWCFKNFAKQN